MAIFRLACVPIRIRDVFVIERLISLEVGTYSPADYHRYNSPVSAEIRSTKHIAGQYYVRFKLDPPARDADA